MILILMVEGARAGIPVGPTGASCAPGTRSRCSLSRADTWPCAKTASGGCTGVPSVGRACSIGGRCLCRDQSGLEKVMKMNCYFCVILILEEHLIYLYSHNMGMTKHNTSDNVI